MTQYYLHGGLKDDVNSEANKKFYQQLVQRAEKTL
jgi:hypothetical protein